MLYFPIMLQILTTAPTFPPIPKEIANNYQPKEEKAPNKGSGRKD